MGNKMEIQAKMEPFAPGYAAELTDFICRYANVTQEEIRVTIVFEMDTIPYVLKVKYTVKMGDIESVDCACDERIKNIDRIIDRSVGVSCRMTRSGCEGSFENGFYSCTLEYITIRSVFCEDLQAVAFFTATPINRRGQGTGLMDRFADVAAAISHPISLLETGFTHLHTGQI